MGSELAILISPDCPPADDSEIQALLLHLADLAGAQWACLELRPRESVTCDPIVVGEPDESGIAIPLKPGRHFAAILRLGCTTPPTSGFSEIASFALRKTLQARRYWEQVTILRSALDTTSSAVLLFGADGQIVYANPPADRLLSRQTEDSLVVVTRGSAPQPLFTLLCHLVEEIAEQPDRSTTWQGTLAVSDGSVLACEIIRMQPSPSANSSNGADVNVLVILQTTKELPDRCLSAFAASYHLSRREAEVLRHLVGGLKAQEIATQLGISPHTVRDHLKNLYRKTETRSHTELLNLVSNATSTPPVGD